MYKKEVIDELLAQQPEAQPPPPWMDMLSDTTGFLCFLYVLIFVGGFGLWGSQFAESGSSSQVTAFLICALLMLPVALLQCAVVGFLKKIADNTTLGLSK